jgi:hypothetical protein
VGADQYEGILVQPLAPRVKQPPFARLFSTVANMMEGGGNRFFVSDGSLLAIGDCGGLSSSLTTSHLKPHNLKPHNFLR